MEKQFIISDVAIGTVEPVNISNMFTFRKFDPNGNGLGSTSSKYAILFYKAEAYLDHEPIKWNYASESDRDCDYNKIVQLVAQSINEVTA